MLEYKNMKQNQENLPTPEEITKLGWNKKAKEGWGDDRQPDPFFEEFYEQHPELKKPENRVLDVGCGNGVYAARMAQEGSQVTGIDISAEMRSRAVKKLKELGLQAQILEGKSSKLNFPNGSFDFVISIGVFHHNTWEDIEKSFAEVSRVLESGKFFLFMARSINDFAKLRKQISDVGYTAVDLEGWKKGMIQHYFTKEELMRLAIENGFEMIGEPKEAVDTENKHARWWVVYRKK